MSLIQEVKKQVLKDIKRTVGKGYAPSLEDLSVPPDPKMGDIAFPCFLIAKGMKKNPMEVATELAAQMGPTGFIKEITAKGPYVNFRINDHVFGEALLGEILKQKQAYGTSDRGDGKTVLVEFANVNTHKVMHVGHLRNFSVGQAATNVLRASGYRVIPGFFINDLGQHVAQVIWAMSTLHDGEEPEKEERMAFLGKAYVEAVKRTEKSKKAKEEVSAIYKELETLKGPHVALWKKTRKWSMAYFRERFKELGLTLEFEYFESELIQETKDLIEDLKKRGIVVLSQGAWIVDLSDEDLGVNLLVKSDGTLLYNAKDLALAMRKEDDYHPQRSIYVIDARQSHVMQQLFATTKRMGLASNMEHLSYDFVTLKGGAMSSRKGTVIVYEELRDKLLEMAKKETRERHPDWSDKKVAATARAIAYAAMRFSMLKQDLDKQIVFDLEEALSFDGFTGPYLLYSYARICSLLAKAGKRKRVFTATHLQTDVEHRLLLALSAYPETVFRAGETFHLSGIAQYLFDVCKTFAEFYEQVPVLQSEGPVREERLALIEAVQQVLENGFGLLGMEMVEEM